MPELSVDAATYELDVEVMPLMRAELEQGADVGAFLTTTDDLPSIQLHADQSAGVTRQLRQDRYSETLTHVTLPKQLIDLGRLHGEPYELRAEPGVLTAVFPEYTPSQATITGTLEFETMVSAYSSGEYVVKIATDQIPTGVGDELYAWYDVVEGKVVLYLSADDQSSPETASSRHLDYTAGGDEFRVRLPGDVARSRTLSGSTLEWYVGDKRLAAELPTPTISG